MSLSSGQLVVENTLEVLDRMRNPQHGFSRNLSHQLARVFVGDGNDGGVEPAIKRKCKITVAGLHVRIKLLNHVQKSLRDAFGIIRRQRTDWRGRRAAVRCGRDYAFGRHLGPGRAGGGCVGCGTSMNNHFDNPVRCIQATVMIDDYQTGILVGSRYNPGQFTDELGWAPS